MALGRFVKTPSEIKRYSIEYSNWLDTSEYISLYSVTPTAVNATASNTHPITVDLENGGIGLGGQTSVSFFAFSGDSGVTYSLLVSATTTNGQVKEDTILIEVRAI